MNDIINENIIEIEEFEFNSIQDELNTWKNKYLYLLAEFDNYKKRRIHEDHKKDTYKYEDLFLQLIPVLDNIELAQNQPLDKGVQIIFDQLRHTLEDNGLTQYADSRKFDENIHNAVSVVNDKTKEDGYVIDTLRNGYKYKDKVIRYQDVVVNKTNV